MLPFPKMNHLLLIASVYLFNALLNKLNDYILIYCIQTIKWTLSPALNYQNGLLLFGLHKIIATVLYCS